MRLRKRVEVTKRTVPLLIKIEGVGKGINSQYHNELWLGHEALWLCGTSMSVAQL